MRRGFSGAAKMGAVALALALAFASLRALAPDTFLRTVSPALALGSALSANAGGIFAGFSDARALRAKNAALTEENAALALENRALSEKADDLAALIGSTGKTTGGVIAGVLARPPVAAYDALIVGAGAEDGVASGMEAFGKGGVPLGVVTLVTAHFSRITLFSAPGVSVSGWAGSARVPLTLLGAGAGAFKASAPRDAGMKEGDAVFAPGPGALPLGIIAKVGGEASDPVATIFVLPASNPFSVTTVVLRDAGASLAGVSLGAASTPAQ